MADDADLSTKRVRGVRRTVAPPKLGKPRGIRHRSLTYVMGLPLYEIAIGPESKLKEKRGHARAFIAIGDIATGVIAIGGIARGCFAFGGISVGLIGIGGCSLGILVGVGGVAAGALAIGGLVIGLIACGGAAVGLVAAGGGAVGYYAYGAGAVGKYVVSVTERHPEAIRFIKEWVPAFQSLLQPKQ